MRALTTLRESRCDLSKFKRDSLRRRSAGYYVTIVTFRIDIAVLGLI